MANQNLVDYINQSRQGGLSDDQIRQALLGAGWSASDIDAAFDINSKPISLSPNISSIPRGVKIIAVLGYIGSVIEIIVGISIVAISLLLLTVLKETFKNVPVFGSLAKMGTTMFLPIGLAIAIGGVLLFMASRGLKKGESWARVFFVIIIILNLISTIYGLVKTINASNVSIIALGLFIAAYLLTSKKVKAAFNKQLDTSDKKKLIIMTLVLLLLVAVAWFIPYFVNNNLNLETGNSINQNIPAIIATSTAPTSGILKLEGLSPKETYLKIKPEGDKVKTFADMEAFVLKYGSKNQVTKMEQNREKILALPQSFRDSLASFMADDATLLDKITDIQETIKGNTATLSISTVKPEVTGIVIMVLEGTLWKIDSESWKHGLPIK